MLRFLSQRKIKPLHLLIIIITFATILFCVSLYYALFQAQKIYDVVIIYNNINNQETRPPVMCVDTVYAEPPANSSIIPKFDIPKIIHITTKDPFELSFVRNWENMNPGFEVRVYSDDDIRRMVSEEMPEYLELFDGFEYPVERADFWRYLVMYLHGGVYVDSDVEPRRRIDRWIEKFTLEKSSPVIPDVVIGAEVHLDQEQMYRQGFTKQIQWCQWVLAGKKGHEIFKRTLRSIHDHVKMEKLGIINNRGYLEIILRTGPGKFTQVIESYLKEYGLTSEDVIDSYQVVGGVGFLPPISFGYRHNTDPCPDNFRDVYVAHHFLGSWKKDV
eukprot:TRINITY_DN12474_c0_g1_i1.p1 TRINITY_DN12474_c0_g1~~TRINITY_DN12474_c0_g1_i1.p1  ORF type:complete len:330 (-),score=25.99 TRINITY_DN12474_c0_g1_i1:31-1020(-)